MILIGPSLIGLRIKVQNTNLSRPTNSEETCAWSGGGGLISWKALAAVVQGWTSRNLY